MACVTISSSAPVNLADTSDSEINSELASAYEVSDGTFGLEDFNYKSDSLTNITFLHLKNTSLIGITVI